MTITANAARTFFKLVTSHVTDKEDFTLPLDAGPEALALAVNTYIDQKIEALANAKVSARASVASSFRAGLLLPDVVSSERLASIIEQGDLTPDPSRLGLIKDGIHEHVR